MDVSPRPPGVAAAGAVDSAVWEQLEVPARRSPPRVGPPGRGDGPPGRGGGPPDRGGGPPGRGAGRASAMASEEPPSASVLLSVRRLGDDRDAVVAPVEVSVAAGGRGGLVALIRNQSGIVDNYDLAVVGFPDGWWTITPRTSYLVPFGRGEGYEQEVMVALHPPRTPEAEARAWPFAVIATSHAVGEPVASAPASVVIEPFWQIEAAIDPHQGEGRLGAAFTAFVRNGGNAPMEARVRLEDEEEGLVFEASSKILTAAAVRAALLPGLATIGRRLQVGQQLRRAAPMSELHKVTAAPTGAAGRLVAPELAQAKQSVRQAGTDAQGRTTRRLSDRFAGPVTVSEITASLAPGQPQRLPFIARPKRQIVIGRRTNRRFTVTAEALDGSVRTSSRQATLRQRPWLPWWLLLLLPLIAAAIIAYLLLKPKLVTVPDVRGLPSAFAAEQRLGTRGLALAAGTQTQIDPMARPGTVIGQTPTAGAHVKKGSPVSILVATASRRVRVPRLVGLSLAKADGRLTARGLTLGAVSPKPSVTEVVSSQIPTAGTSTTKGTPVAVFLSRRKKKKTAAGKKSAAAAAAAAAAAGAGGAALVVPPIAGATLSAYQRLLVKRGLKAKAAARIDPARRGAVIATSPVPGTKVKAGGTVAVTVSAGFPDLAFDDGTSLAAVLGSSGLAVKDFAAAAGVGVTPTWDPAATEVAYVAGGSIFVVAARGPTPPPVELAASTASVTYADPSFAPHPGSGLLASVRQATGADGLCLSRVRPAGAASAPRCLPVPGWRLGAITWAPDGRSVLVAATSAGDSGEFGLLQFVTAEPFSGRISQWTTTGALVTPHPSGHGVLAGAVSPDGRRLAVLADTTGGRFRLLLTGPTDLMLQHAKVTSVAGCALAWRSDGLELAVVVAGDPACATPTGPIFGLSVVKPESLKMIALKGRDPAWQPVSLALPKTPGSGP